MNCPYCNCSLPAPIKDKDGVVKNFEAMNHMAVCGFRFYDQGRDDYE